MARIGRRAGRITASELGPGTLAQNALTGTRRIFTILSGTTTGGTLTLTQGRTLMATIDGAVVTVASQIGAFATASLVFVAHNRVGGTITIEENTDTLQRTVRVFVYLVGRPDPARGATVPRD